MWLAQDLLLPIWQIGGLTNNNSHHFSGQAVLYLPLVSPEPHANLSVHAKVTLPIFS